MKHTALPYVMGGLMGPMMLWMMHDSLMSGAALSWGVIGFIAAHVAVFGVVVIVAVFGARLNPRLRMILSRLHRPSGAHLAQMMVAAVLSASLVHFSVHAGGI